MKISDQPVIDYLTAQSWKTLLAEEFEKTYFKEMEAFLAEEKSSGNQIYPPLNLIFNAFNLTPLSKVKVVLLGQDPYHRNGQAHGLCFSVPAGTPFPPSLRNIFKELNADTGIPVPVSGNLENWANQGVLMLNATLTVRAGVAGSHQNRGWEQFTDAVIRLLNTQMEGLIFILWGKYAQAKANLIDEQKHFVLKAAHPSPFSAYNGFFGCSHFSKTNALLINSGQTPIDFATHTNDI